MLNNLFILICFLITSNIDSQSISYEPTSTYFTKDKIEDSTINVYGVPKGKEEYFENNVNSTINKVLGHQFIVELKDCNNNIIKNIKLVDDIIIKGIKYGNASLINHWSHQHDQHLNDQQVITALSLLSESHVSVHIWPKYNFVSLDVFTCGETANPSNIAKYIENAFNCTIMKTVWKYTPRGAPTYMSDLDDLLLSNRLKNHITTKISKYQRIDIYELKKIKQSNKQKAHASFGYGKALFLDGHLQIVQSDEYIYHEALVHPALLAHPNPKRVLIIGGGDGGALREVLKHESVQVVVLVELDSMVTSLSITYLNEIHQGAFNDDRVHLRFTDGIEYMKKIGDKTFDVIIVDALDPEIESNIKSSTIHNVKDTSSTNKKQKDEEKKIINANADGTIDNNSINKIKNKQDQKNKKTLLSKSELLKVAAEQATKKLSKNGIIVCNTGGILQGNYDDDNPEAIVANDGMLKIMNAITHFVPSVGAYTKYVPSFRGLWSFVYGIKCDGDISKVEIKLAQSELVNMYNLTKPVIGLPLCGGHLDMFRISDETSKIFDELISNRIKEPLKSLDGVAFNKMLTLPKQIRDVFEWVQILIVNSIF